MNKQFLEIARNIKKTHTHKHGRLLIVPGQRLYLGVILGAEMTSSRLCKIMPANLSQTDMRDGTFTVHIFSLLRITVDVSNSIPIDFDCVYSYFTESRKLNILILPISLLSSLRSSDK